MGQGAILSIDEADIHRLVHGFYQTVQGDPVLGPLFMDHIAAERWPVHLDKMCAFWSSVLLRTSRYEGKPLAPHLGMPELTDRHFQRWLCLFRTVAQDAFEPAEAARVITFAERIAQSFRMSIAFHRGQDTASIQPLP